MSEGKSALFPNYARFPLTLVKGQGGKVWDDQGNEYLDFVNGIAVTNLGHCHPGVSEKLKAQIDTLWHVGNLYHIPNQEKLAKLLTRESGLDAAFFCNSGAEANEAAIKLARRYHAKVAGQARPDIITFHQSFHGRTLATLTATGQDKVKDGFHPLPEGFVYAPYNQVEGLESLVTERTGAIMLELVQGEGGVNPATPEFVAEILRLRDQYGLLVIVDEIQTGIGRTGKLFAFQHYGFVPDIITLAKGLGNGFPIGAMLGAEKLREAFSAGSHGSTFGGTPIATAAAIATIEIMLEEKLPERVAELGASFRKLLETKLAGNPLVRGVRGLGLLVGVACETPVAGIIADLQNEGLLTMPAGPNVLRLLPNFYVTQEELEFAAERIAGVLAKHAEAAAAATGSNG
ncbi:acetylornithine transaminase [Paenibacillus thermoaerophilus]|uniref:Acetylornithine aminotransferase n=1 Tax=Paenibacillus thermoaerophilus TaxID=1215385 RepID=A0ABW2V5M3_9BACL|nr:acetylornithine transaminase [Paenibacillus thermoaerophilus]TMV09207.1 acetylornithine transaminase [Paenibacillus thermoaerophilus]